MANRSFLNCRCALRKLRFSRNGWAGMIAARRDGRKERQRHTRGQSTSAAHAPSRLYDVPRYKRPSSSHLLRNNFCLIAPCFLSFFPSFLGAIVTIQPILSLQGSIFLRPAGLQTQSLRTVAQSTHENSATGLGSRPEPWMRICVSVDLDSVIEETSAVFNK